MRLQKKHTPWRELVKKPDLRFLVALERALRAHSMGRMLVDRFGSSGPDLAGDFFVWLLQQGQIARWTTAGTNAEIEQELNRFQIVNWATIIMRGNFPESYRIARRVSRLLQSEATVFRCHADPNKKGKLANRPYGLAHWRDMSMLASYEQREDAISKVANRRRSSLRTGRGQGAPIIITNNDLKNLLIEIFEAVGALLTVKQIRQLAERRVVVLDPDYVPLFVSNDDGKEYMLQVADIRPRADQLLQTIEEQQFLGKLAQEVFDVLPECKQARAGLKKREKFWKIILKIWDAQLSQAEIAKKFQVSDSLISTYKNELRSVVETLQLQHESCVGMLEVLHEIVVSNYGSE